VANVLEKIVDDKRSEIAQRKRDRPLKSFVSSLKPTQKDFFAALAKPNASFIFECKKASPSKGLIRANFDLDEIIDAYAPFAACISVLTDEKYFQGKFEYLQYVTERVSQPVINKDFFVDEYQVHLARYCNADAILLMLSVLNNQQYLALSAVAKHYQMDVLTEVSNEQEMLRAIELKANIIGINNRNLRDLSTDLATTERLVPLLENIDYEHVVISESGIYTHSDVQRLAPLCNGFLVGSALMAETDLSAAVKDLIYPNVKVCGVTTVDFAARVKQSPAVYAGLIFAPQSKRLISLADAKVITSSVEQSYVGVFVDQSITDVADVAKELCLSAVQLHGQEDEAYMAQLRGALPKDCMIWKALSIDVDTVSEEDLPALMRAPDHPLWKLTDKLLLDCKVGRNSGGTGQQFNWTLLSQIPHKQQIILAGGITPSNATEAVAAGVSMLDVNSGIEDAPGIKNSNKLDMLFSSLRAY
jgi:indole-3-glycerol phosphate synthase/phosphoribosylanthranilate isomerase